MANRIVTTTSVSAFFLLALLGGCSDVGIGLAHHPLDCAIGIAWGDCLPGTPGYNNGGGQRNPQETIETRRTNDDDECRSYGLTFGTPEYAHCRETMLTLHASQDQAANVDRRARAAAALSLLKQSQQQQEMQSYSRPIYQNPHINCTSNAIGNMVSTNCN